MKIVFMGTPEFAMKCLAGLDDRNVVAVFTQPDRPSGRGKRMQAPPAKIYAQQMGLPVFQPEKIKSAQGLAMLGSLDADIFVVAAYGQLLSQKILDMPKYGAINVHASLLPKYRGASPIQQAIAHGDTTTGITIMQMDKGMDTGDMLLKREIAIDVDDTGGTLHDKLADIAPFALIDALDLIAAGKVTPEPQDDTLATHAPLITKQMAQIDWGEPPKDIVNMIRAYNPFPGAHTQLDGMQVKVWDAEIIDGKVHITYLTPPGGKKMSMADYLRGKK